MRRLARRRRGRSRRVAGSRPGRKRKEVPPATGRRQVCRLQVARGNSWIGPLAARYHERVAAARRECRSAAPRPGNTLESHSNPASARVSKNGLVAQAADRERRRAKRQRTGWPQRSCNCARERSMSALRSDGLTAYEDLVVAGVAADLVAGGGDLPDELGIRAGHQADDEEGRADVVTRRGVRGHARVGDDVSRRRARAPGDLAEEELVPVLEVDGERHGACGVGAPGVGGPFGQRLPSGPTHPSAVDQRIRSGRVPHADEPHLPCVAVRPRYHHADRGPGLMPHGVGRRGGWGSTRGPCARLVGGSRGRTEPTQLGGAPPEPPPEPPGGAC